MPNPSIPSFPTGNTPDDRSTPSLERSPAANTKSLRIAVADENPSMREYYQEALTRLGHEVVAARGGRQLVQLCGVARPDLMITDVRLADLDGVDAAAEICRAQPLPVILASAYYDADLLRRASELGVQAYLIKPIRQAELAVTIALALAGFAKIQAIHKEMAELRQALEERKLIERAKRVVSKRTGAEEDEAFRRMRKLSSTQNINMVETARLIMSAEELFQMIEEGRTGRGAARRDNFPTSC